MIITLKGADFSQSNIGTLDSWFISYKTEGSISKKSGLTSVTKGEPITAEFTLAEGAELEYIKIYAKTDTAYETALASSATTSITYTPTQNIVIYAKATVVEGDTGSSGGSDIISRSIPLMSLPLTFVTTSNSFDPATTRVTAYGNAKAGDILEISSSVGCSIHKLVSKNTPPMTPLFIQSSHSETFSETLKGSWGVTTSYTFEEDIRFNATGKDLTDSSRDFTGSEFTVYSLRRNFVKGQSAPIWSYIGIYDTTNNCFPINQEPNTLRALIVLDVKAGDVIATTNLSYGFNVYKFTDGTSAIEEQLLSGYSNTTWTSDKNQRIMVIAKNNSDTVNNMSNVDPNNVFTVTFNS